MAELGEPITTPDMHSEPEEKCPFCPPEEPEEYKTYPGAENNSKKLAEIMEDPASLPSKQSGARPQTAKAGRDGYQQEQAALKPRKEDKTKWYTHQAHHLISGNQALKGSAMEDWILASAKNEKDTGYSVNSTGNGFWAPSVPKDYVGSWGPRKNVLSDDERQELAEKVMDDANAQIHIGPHNISDSDDPEGRLHFSYDQYIIEKLEAMSNRMHAWSQHCFLCEPEKKTPQATYKVHDALDRLSSHLQREITGSRQSWRIFISKYALNYHKPVCTHARRRVL